MLMIEWVEGSSCFSYRSGQWNLNTPNELTYESNEMSVHVVGAE